MEASVDFCGPRGIIGKEFAGNNPQTRRTTVATTQWHSGRDGDEGTESGDAGAGQDAL